MKGVRLHRALSHDLPVRDNAAESFRSRERTGSVLYDQPAKQRRDIGEISDA